MKQWNGQPNQVDISLIYQPAWLYFSLQWNMKTTYKVGSFLSWLPLLDNFFIILMLFKIDKVYFFMQSNKHHNFLSFERQILWVNSHSTQQETWLNALMDLPIRDLNYYWLLRMLPMLCMQYLINFMLEPGSLAIIVLLLGLCLLFYL